jgi:hypothetical protein
MQGAGNICPRPWDITVSLEEYGTFSTLAMIFPGKGYKYSISDAAHRAFFKEGYGTFLKAAP